jgi:hypothetical protein
LPFLFGESSECGYGKKYKRESFHRCEDNMFPLVQP